MVGRMMAFQRCPHLEPRKLYVMLHCKEEFKSQMELGLLTSWSESKEIILGYLHGPHVLPRWEREAEGKVKVIRCARAQVSLAGFDHGGRGPWAKKYGQLLGKEKGREWILPWSLQKATQRHQHLNPSAVRLVWDSNLQSCKGMNLHLFKPLNLW